MRIGANNTKARSARDTREGDPAYEAWKIEHQAEVDAANAADPEYQFKQAANIEAEANRQTALTKRLSGEYLAAFGNVERGRCSEEEKVAARVEFRATATDYIRTEANGKTLVDMVDRNQLHPGVVASYLLCHAILQHWSGYPDTVVPVEVEPVVIDPRTPSEKAAARYEERMTKIVVYDPLDNKGYTEFDLENKVDSKTELRLRRLMEGRIGNERYEEYMQIQDIKATQAADRASQAAEDDGLDGPSR